MYEPTMSETSIPGKPEENIRVLKGAETCPPSDASSEEGGSDGESVQLVDTADKLISNMYFMRGLLPTLSTSKQSHKPSLGEDAILIKYPTASQLPHGFLNPYLYWHVGEIESLEKLAILLKSREDWLEQYEKATANTAIISRYHILRNLSPASSEATIQMNLAMLVSEISSFLQIFIIGDDQTTFCVGGILALHEYDIIGRSDVRFTNAAGKTLIATEIKTVKSFPVRHLWYHQSRGIQLFSTMYAQNCPTFLLNQHCWKLVVENEDRNAVFTYPYHTKSHPNPALDLKFKQSMLNPMDKDIIKAIIICLLSERSSLRYAEQQATIEEASSLPDVKDMHLKSSPRQDATRLNLSLKSHAPSVLMGHKHGLPIYSEIRVLTQDAVLKIEEEIAQEKKNAKESLIKQESDKSF